MRLLPSEQKQAIVNAIAEFEKHGELSIYEPCDCGSNIRHNNGGNYHDEVFLKRDSGQVFIKHGTTCELVPEQEWFECDDYKGIIEKYADWL